MSGNKASLGFYFDCVCVCVCSGQRTALSVIPQVLSALFFKSVFLPDLGLAEQAG